MHLKSITITGLRNLKKQTLDFADKEGIYALIGPNGHGKTNMLEAIYLLALSKSFRASSNQDLITFGKDFTNIKAETGEKELELITTLKPAAKRLKVNGVIKPATEFVGHLKVVFFSPDDLSVISLTPAVRRRYLDVVLGQLDQAYLETSLNYSHAVKQRNSLLKMIAEGKVASGQLDVWDEQIEKHGSFIIKKRQDLIKEITPVVKEKYAEIAQSKDEIDIEYQSSTCDDFAEKLAANRDRDIATRSTSIGPHRDDLTFYLNRHDMRGFSSRGEWRSLVLALKFAEIEYIKSQTSQTPVLLLDDVFSELDDARQKYLIKAIKGVQTFISTTHKEHLDGFEEVKVHEVKEGAIS